MNRLHGEKQSWTNRTQCIRNVLPFHFDRNDCTKMLEHWTKKMAKLIEWSSWGGTNRHNDISTQFWEHFHCRWIGEWWLIIYTIFAYRQSMWTFSKPPIGGLVKNANRRTFYKSQQIRMAVMAIEHVFQRCSTCLLNCMRFFAARHRLYQIRIVNVKQHHWMETKKVV